MARGHSSCCGIRERNPVNGCCWDNSPTDHGNKAIATSLQTERLRPDAAGIARAAELLRTGALVAFGTETVYGLGADATNGRAVAEIYRVKGRPAFNPLIVHVADQAAANQLIDVPKALIPLTTFWPGPLTLVAPRRPSAPIADIVQAGLPTLAVRVPRNAAARDLLRHFGRPVAAPSANVSGRISPSTADHVLADLDWQIAAVLDTGPCDVGLESTIVGVGDAGPALLRPGGIAAEDLEAAIGQPLNAPAPSADISAPGQLASHYAPDVALVMDVRSPTDATIHIGFGDETGSLNLSPGGDLVEAAANLFALLHRANVAARAAGKTISVSPVPTTGLGIAINDRLRRAAAPRGS